MYKIIIMKRVKKKMSKKRRAPLLNPNVAPMSRSRKFGSIDTRRDLAMLNSMNKVLAPAPLLVGDVPKKPFKPPPVKQKTPKSVRFAPKSSSSSAREFMKMKRKTGF